MLTQGWEGHGVAVMVRALRMGTRFSEPKTGFNLMNDVRLEQSIWKYKYFGKYNTTDVKSHRLKNLAHIFYVNKLFLSTYYVSVIILLSLFISVFTNLQGLIPYEHEGKTVDGACASLRFVCFWLKLPLLKTWTDIDMLPFKGRTLINICGEIHFCPVLAHRDT